MSLAKRLGAVAAGLCLAACTSFSAPSPRTSSVYADHLVGRLANLRQDHAAAAERYFEALQRDPSNESLLDGAITASLASGDIARAQQAARLAPRQGAPAYVYLLRAAEDIAANRFRSASASLDRVEGQAAEELAGRMLLVWSRAAEGRVDDVILDLSPLASIRPYGSLFAYQQAMALDYAGRGEEALTNYLTGSTGGMFLPPAIERHADLLVRAGQRDTAAALLQADASRANPALQAALQRMQAGQPISGQTLTPARGAAIGLYGLAAIFMQEHDATNALAALSLAQVLDPRLDAARIMFAQTQSELGHIDLARRALAAISADSPYAETARVMDAWALSDQGHDEEALALAIANAERGDARSKRALADMYRNMDRYDEAEPLYSELISLQPNEWRLYFARGAARERLGRWPDAEADLRHALELSPNQPDVMNYLGYSWIDRGVHMEEGLALIQRAVELRPMSGAIIDSLGWAYFRMGDYAQALEHLEHAVELEPSDPTLNDHLGDVYWRLGRRIEARFQWQRALTLEPLDAAAIQAKVQDGLAEEAVPQSARR